MKVYAIHDRDLEHKEAIGYLFYYEKADAYIIELRENLNEWEAPLLFKELVKKGIYTIRKDYALLWVKERVIPSGRQNIGAILKNAGLKEYNEMALLRLSKGICSQDNCYIDEVSEDDLPDEISKRRLLTITECFPVGNDTILCMFRDDSVRKLNLQQLSCQYKEISHVLKNKDLFWSVRVGVGGYSITFQDIIEIEVSILREKGGNQLLTAEDFYAFAHNNVVDTTGACELLQCSRQNLSYLIKSKKLEPLILGTKENLFSRGAIEQIKNE